MTERDARIKALEEQMARMEALLAALQAPAERP
jgi:hypothetical protein